MEKYSIVWSLLIYNKIRFNSLLFFLISDPCKILQLLDIILSPSFISYSPTVIYLKQCKLKNNIIFDSFSAL